MDDKDHVFARFKDNKPASAERHERLSIPGRGGTSSSRSVEVVHLRMRAAPAPDRTRHTDRQLRAASWEDGFPATAATVTPASVELDLVEPPKPVTHVMPAWAPTVNETDAAASAIAEAPAIVFTTAPSAPPKRISKRRVADPFDSADEGANCLRCGYAIELARQKRGMITCDGCG